MRKVQFDESTRLLLGVGVTHEFTPKRNERPGLYGLDPRARADRSARNGIPTNRTERSPKERQRRERHMSWKELYQDYDLI